MLISNYCWHTFLLYDYAFLVLPAQEATWNFYDGLCMGFNDGQMAQQLPTYRYQWATLRDFCENLHFGELRDRDILFLSCA